MEHLRRRTLPRGVIVIGAGLAGAGVVTALRGRGFDGRITVLGAEGIPPYDRPPLSKELLSRTEPVWLADDLGLDVTLADDVRLATPAVGLRPDDDGWTVQTAGAEVSGDAVVLATGSRPVRPPGWDAALTLHTAADADRLRAALTPGTRLVVIGAGWVGAEVAGVAAAAGVDVTVVEAAAAPLTAALGPAGGLTTPWYADAGVRLLLGARVVSIDDAGVTLADGQVLAADVVLAAVGARPWTRWAEGAPAAQDGSWPVAPGGQVLDAPAGLFAVGDVARRRSGRHGWVPGGHWDGALRGPAVVAAAVLGAEDGPDDPAPYVFSHQLGHDLALFGIPGPDDDVVPRGRSGVLWFRLGSDVLTAVLTVDRPRDASAARRLFTGDALPRLDRDRAADEAIGLRDAARARPHR